jgi:hypothetical protein
MRKMIESGKKTIDNWINGELSDDFESVWD